jgi:soluble lytic murein transglycosylase
MLTPVRKTPEYLGILEPGVRLYLSTFAYRSNDTISMFRMLDSVFRTQSEYVVDSTLKLFYPLRHLDAISANVKKVNPLLIAALIRQESAFQEKAHSRVGAIGLMQLMPATAHLMDRTVYKKNLFDADTNVRLGVKYFEVLVDRYNGDVEYALAAYNAGADVVDRWQKRYAVKNRLLFLDLIPFAETRNYVTLIGRNYYWYSKIYSEQLKQARGIAQLNEVEFRALKSQ